MKVLIKYLLISLGSFTICACGNGWRQEGGNDTLALAENTDDIAATAKGLANPEERWEMPPELQEVSGIALMEDSRMACVQDEKGAIYLYDLKESKIDREIPFASPGDFESITLVGQTAYVLRSDGTIFEVTDFLGGTPVAKSYPSGLAPTQNTEGLAYDEAGNRLLIACKGFDKSLGRAKAIYAFDLKTKQMSPKPVITIPLAQQLIVQHKKLKSNGYDVLQPSAIALAPQGGKQLYLLDAVNQTLLVMNETGKIQQVVDISKSLMTKPEGIAFSPTGEMYICNDGGKKDKGLILKFASGAYHNE